jgi:predicted nuclease of predicted toxin-antitoxin system
MRIVLDACVPARLCKALVGHDAVTVGQLLGTTDRDDGPLLDQIAGRCEVFITMDRGIPYQQRLGNRPFAILLLRAHSNRIEHVVPLVPQIQAALSAVKPGELRVLGA